LRVQALGNCAESGMAIDLSTCAPLQSGGARPTGRPTRAATARTCTLIIGAPGLHGACSTTRRVLCELTPASRVAPCAAAQGARDGAAAGFPSMTSYVVSLTSCWRGSLLRCGARSAAWRAKGRQRCESMWVSLVQATCTLSDGCGMTRERHLCTLGPKCSRLSREARTVRGCHKHAYTEKGAAEPAVCTGAQGRRRVQREQVQRAHCGCCCVHPDAPGRPGLCMVVIWQAVGLIVYGWSDSPDVLGSKFWLARQIPTFLQARKVTFARAED